MKRRDENQAASFHQTATAPSGAPRQGWSLDNPRPVRGPYNPTPGGGDGWAATGPVVQRRSSRERARQRTHFVQPDTTPLRTPFTQSIRWFMIRVFFATVLLLWFIYYAATGFIMPKAEAVGERWDHGYPEVTTTEVTSPSGSTKYDFVGTDLKGTISVTMFTFRHQADPSLPWKLDGQPQGWVMSSLRTGDTGGLMVRFILVKDEITGKTDIYILTGNDTSTQFVNILFAKPDGTFSLNKR